MTVIRGWYESSSPSQSPSARRSTRCSLMHHLASQRGKRGGAGRPCGSPPLALGGHSPIAGADKAQGDFLATVCREGLSPGLPALEDTCVEKAEDAVNHEGCLVVGSRC